MDQFIPEQAIEIVASAYGMKPEDVGVYMYFDPRKNGEVLAMVEAVVGENLDHFVPTNIKTLVMHIEDKQAIWTALDGLGLDATINTAWQQEMESCTASGHFCPTDPKEMGEAVAAVREGKEMPRFRRTS